ncbi:MAG: sulfurtransferase complex subunit TusB [Candidatus Helarchaeota archaeon]
MVKTLVLLSDIEPRGVELVAETKDSNIALCLLQDAVYFAINKKAMIESILKQDKKIYALENDVNLRGLKGLINPDIKLVSYADVIDIVLEYENTLNF